jgi:hypothetical protein
VILTTPIREKIAASSSPNRMAGSNESSPVGGTVATTTPSSCATSTASMTDGGNFLRSSLILHTDGDDEMIQPSDFEKVVKDVDSHWYGYMWSVTLGIVGIFDILASVEPTIRTYGGCFDVDGQTINQTCHHEFSFCSMWAPFMRWLARNDTAISFTFSLLWFKLSFNKASWARDAAILQQDKAELLSDEKVENGNERETKAINFSPQTIYYLEILVDLVLLPVGFYVILYHFIHTFLTQGNGIWKDLATPMYETIVVTVDKPDSDGGVKYEIFTEHSKITLLFAVLNHVRLILLGATSVARVRIVKHLKKSTIPHLIKTLLRDAIRRPKKFRRKLQAVLKYIRWARYIAPIIGTVNKLKGNIQDTLIKSKQRMIARRQRRIRELLWKAKPIKLQEEEAVIMIQSAWRAHMSKKYTRVLIIVSKDKKEIAAQRIQATLRRKLAEARHRLLLKKLELRRLENERRKEPEKMDKEDRRRLYQLQDEFTAEATKMINRKVLMRPNTNFAVLWKILFCCCIAIEISQKAAAPFLKRKLTNSKERMERMTIRELIAEKLIPNKTSERHRCIDCSKKSWAQNLHLTNEKNVETCANENDFPWYCHGPYSTWNDNYRDAVFLALTPSPVSERQECKKWTPDSFADRLFHSFFRYTFSPPWYCFEPYATAQSYYRTVADFFIDEFKVVVSIVCFLDVFITFFTGEIDHVTGELVPKPFFNRWIFPGLFLQLLVNPSIGSVSNFVFSVIKQVLTLGPIRVLRWTIAVLTPILYAVYKLILKGLETTELDEALIEFQMKQKRRSSVFA